MRHNGLPQSKIVCSVAPRGNCTSAADCQPRAPYRFTENRRGTRIASGSEKLITLALTTGPRHARPGTRSLGVHPRSRQLNAQARKNGSASSEYLVKISIGEGGSRTRTYIPRVRPKVLSGCIIPP
jgi:hypothetical protein